MQTEAYERTDQVLLKLDHVSLNYGPKVILRDVNAKITDVNRPNVTTGQVICFLGPSGMGKTQLSRIIAGLQAPSSGSVSLSAGVHTKKGLVGMVPQNYPLFEFLNVAGNLTVAGKQGGLGPKQCHDKALEFMALFNLEPYAAMFPKALSGGTRQRVAIARQMMCVDHYLVMDEPFSGLDPIMKGKASEAISTLASKDSLNTIIVITHDISEGLAIADMVWLLGRDHNSDGTSISGARLVEQYDLAAMGFAWHPEIQGDGEFQKFVGEVKLKFRSLS